ncbi:MAG TPA: hypothetical protein PLX89_07240 [Verrucomicrobiota bacterium]|nr:hypothetical protein [Verrucomicrobiota bacterium]
MLVGCYEVNSLGQVVAIRISGFIPAGPHAEFGPAHIKFDSEFQAGYLRILQHRNSRHRCVGSFHRHPGSFDRPSSGDLTTDREALASSGSPFLLAGIVTLNNNREDDSSLRIGDLKFDFYLLGRGADSKYVRVVPEICDTDPSEAVPDSLVAYANARGASLTYDLKALRQIPGVGKIELREVLRGPTPTAAIQIHDAHLEVDHLIFRNANGSIEAFIKPAHQSPFEFLGPWLDPTVASHVWISELVLQARRVLRSCEFAPIRARRYEATWWERDPRRLTLERRAMEEMYGSRATLHQDGGKLFWKTTLRESGHTLDVQIIYPADYPFRPPLIQSEKELPLSPHSPQRGKLFCWHAYTNSDWNPSCDTAAVALAAASRWYACLLIYLTLGHWPAAADHPVHQNKHHI